MLKPDPADDPNSVDPRVLYPIRMRSWLAVMITLMSLVAMRILTTVHFQWTPHVIVAGCALFALLNAVRAETRYRRQLHRVRRNLCLACGYDLRESPDRCPECGRPTTQCSAAKLAK